MFKEGTKVQDMTPEQRRAANRKMVAFHENADWYPAEPNGRDMEVYILPQIHATSSLFDTLRSLNHRNNINAFGI